MRNRIVLFGIVLLFIVWFSVGCCAKQLRPTPIPTSLPTPERLQATATRDQTQSELSPVSTPSSNIFAEARLAYAVSLGRKSEIWLTDFVEHIRLVQVEGDTRGVHWSPDGQYLSWALYDYGTHQSSIWVMDADGTKTMIVPWTEKVIGHFWSPDGVVAVKEYDPDDKRHLGIYGLSAGTWQRVPVWLETLPFDTIITFDISPDWQSVAYLQSDSSAVVIRHKDGREWSIDLPPGTRRFESVKWSSDGQWLALGVAEVGGIDTNIFISRTDDKDLRRLTSGTGERIIQSWSPSENYLAFSMIDSEDANQLCYVDTRTTGAIPHCIKSVDAGGSLLWVSDDEWLMTTCRIDENLAWHIYRVSLVDEAFTSLTQGDGMESQDKGMECCLALRPAD